MSLISAKNFIAPFTNVVHMITILLIAICFAVLRLNGASLSFQSQGSQESVRAVDLPDTDEIPVVSQEAIPDDQFLRNEDIYDPSTGRSYESPRKIVPKKTSGLDDIEKSLGINR